MFCGVLLKRNPGFFLADQDRGFEFPRPDSYFPVKVHDLDSLRRELDQYGVVALGSVWKERCVLELPEVLLSVKIVDESRVADQGGVSFFFLIRE